MVSMSYRYDIGMISISYSYRMNKYHIRTHKDSPGWAFVLLGRKVMANTSLFEANLGLEQVPGGQNEF